MFAAHQLEISRPVTVIIEEGSHHASASRCGSPLRGYGAG
jgi:hypothetical protein